MPEPRPNASAIYLKISSFDPAFKRGRRLIRVRRLIEKIWYVQTDATTPNIVGPAMLEVVASFAQSSLTSCKLCTTAPNNIQQHATGHANGVVGQQCCICLHRAMFIANTLVLTSSATLPNLG